MRFVADPKMDAKNGPIWGVETEDLDATMINWQAGRSVSAHVNSEVDVVVTVLEGAGTLRIDAETFDISQGDVVVIHKGKEREITAGECGLRYLNVHKRRRGLMPTGVRPKS